MRSNGLKFRRQECDGRIIEIVNRHSILQGISLDIGQALAINGMLPDALSLSFADQVSLFHLSQQSSIILVTVNDFVVRSGCWMLDLVGQVLPRFIGEPERL